MIKWNWNPTDWVSICPSPDGVMSFKFDRSHYSSGTQEWKNGGRFRDKCILVKDLIHTSREVIQYSWWSLSDDSLWPHITRSRTSVFGMSIMGRGSTLPTAAFKGWVDHTFRMSFHQLYCLRWDTVGTYRLDLVSGISLRMYAGGGLLASFHRCWW